MDGENRDRDRNTMLLLGGPGRGQVSFDVLKSAYIAEGLSAQDIASRYFLPVSSVEAFIEGEGLPELRKAYIIQGIQKIQNVQLVQANKLMDLETNFKRMRIIQLEAELESLCAYFARYGDFCKRHFSTGEILKDSDGIPMQIRLPNVSREIAQLKESVTMSEGVRQMLHRLDEIINSGRKPEPAEDPDTFDISSVGALFESKGEED